jgi:thioredoxin 1
MQTDEKNNVPLHKVLKIQMTGIFVSVLAIGIIMVGSLGAAPERSKNKSNKRQRGDLDMRKMLLSGLLIVLMTGVGFAAETQQPVPTPGMVTMVDVGAHKCIPCKMMAPIIEELKKDYAGTASIIFLDVWESQDAQTFAHRNGVRSIPTQIFYDKSGKEISRHTGFMDKQSIVDVLAKLGAKPALQPKKG